MSLQQIDLYLPEFRPSREPLRATQLAVIAAAALVLMLLLSLWQWWSNSQLQADYDARQAQLTLLQAQAEQLRTLQPKSESESLSTEITDLQAEVAHRQKIRHLISDQNIGNSAGFSAHFEAMSRQHLRSLSLQSFSLREGGGYVELEGLVRRADQIPLLLRRLRKEPAFESVRFGVLNIERSEEDERALEFTLGPQESEAGTVANNQELPMTPLTLLLQLNKQAQNDLQDNGSQEHSPTQLQNTGSGRDETKQNDRSDASAGGAR